MVNHINHNMSYTRLYRIWIYMKQRCYNSNNKHYKSYGGKGVTVCDEWIHNPDKFCEWGLANGYTDDMSIDRIDFDKGYSPDNCRWVSLHHNKKRHKNNIKMELEGVVYGSIHDFSDATGYPVSTVRYWIKTGSLYDKCGAKVVT